MIKFVYGKGKGNSYTRSLGEMSAELNKPMLNMTLKEIASELRKQLKIKDGEIDLLSLSFSCSKRKTNEVQ